MKPGKDIHDIFLFYTPQLMDIYFAYLKNKIQKAVGITTLLVRGEDLANVHSESHMLDEKLFKLHPHVSEEVLSKGNDELNDQSEIRNEMEKTIDLSKQSKIKHFSKNAKSKHLNKSCIINKKAS